VELRVEVERHDMIAIMICIRPLSNGSVNMAGYGQDFDTGIHLAQKLIPPEPINET
jgi:hypothetical protein